MEYLFLKSTYFLKISKQIHKIKILFLTATIFTSFSSFACGQKLVIPGTIKVFETKKFKDGSKEVISWGKMKVLFTKFNNLHSHVYKYPLSKQILITDLSTPSDYYFSSFSYTTNRGSLGWAKRNAEILINSREVQTLAFKTLIDPELEEDLIERFNFSLQRINDSFNSRNVNYEQLRVRLKVDKWLDIVRRTTTISFNTVDLSPELDFNYISFQIKLAKKASVCED
ncbi:MAG: hypothetical protein HN576_01735 [Bacteriovoracaceae bacterium]|jgi:hypothetical protein|nr:hypothetical protein [Bacteriovoracaceae bacterium]